MTGKLYRGILIDPERCVISVADTRGTTKEIAWLVRNNDLCSFRVAEHDDSWDYGWVYDSGLIQGKPIHAFKYRHDKSPIAGRCLLLGVEKEGGATTDALFDIRILRAHVEWLGLIRPEVTWDVDGPVMRSIVTYEKVL